MIDVDLHPETEHTEMLALVALDYILIIVQRPKNGDYDIFKRLRVA